MSLKSKLGKVGRFLLNADLYRYFFYNTMQATRLTKPPVIVCGCPRSGTTLLMSMLDSHPEIHVIPFETSVLQKRPMHKRIFKSAPLNDEFTKLQLSLYLFSGKIKKTANRWCEKTPLNILNVEEINRMYQSQVKFINIIRDGRAVVASKHSRLGYMVKPELWYTCVSEATRLESMPNFISIRYENLLSDSDACLAGIQKFLELESKFDSSSWMAKTRIKGKVPNLVNGKVEGSLITGAVDVSRTRSWEKSESPHLKEFLAYDKYITLNHQLGYD